MRSFAVQVNNSAQRVSRPPRAPGLPLLGSVSMVRNPLPLFVQMYQKVGPVFRVHILGRQYVVLAGPEATGFLAENDGTILSSRAVFGEAARQLHQEKHFIAAVDGEEHRCQRAILRRSFSKEAVKRYIPWMLQATEDVVGSWRVGERLNMASVQLLIGQSLGFAMTGIPVGDHLNDVVTFIRTLDGAAIAGIWPRRMLRRSGYLNAKARVESWIDQIAQDRRAQGPRAGGPDMVDDLLDQSLDAIASRVALQLPFMAGMEAAVVALCLLYELYRPSHRAILERCRTEVDAAFANGMPTAEGLLNMDMLSRVVQETHRLHPIQPAAPRFVEEDFEFGGHHIASGQIILISTTTAHFVPRFFPDPYTFDPSRFLTPLPPNIFGPFLVGDHHCIGHRVTKAALLAAAALVLREVQLEPVPRDYTFQPRLNPLLGPPQSLRLRVVERRQHAPAGTLVSVGGAS
jgi:cytochrome P450